MSLPPKTSRRTVMRLNNSGLVMLSTVYGGPLRFREDFQLSTSTALDKRRARLLLWSASLFLHPDQSFQFDFDLLDLARAEQDPRVDVGAGDAGVQANVE
jgi:hypothetical protein